MKKINEMFLEEVAGYVCEYLLKHGIQVVLSGGAAAQIHSKNQYLSYDLDFIPSSFRNSRKLKKHLKELGFNQSGRYFTHPETDYFLKFPPGPPVVGGEAVREIIDIPLSTGVLRIISPTDSVKDRLTWYYYDNDRQALDVAIKIAESTTVDLGEIERWSLQEGKHSEFLEIKAKFLETFSAPK